jgi:uncharacterized protein YjbI with pentapeptide repeats
MRKVFSFFIGMLLCGTMLADNNNEMKADPEHVKRFKETNKCIKCDLSGIYLVSTDNPGAILTESNLSDAHFTGANLVRATLDKVNFSGAEGSFNISEGSLAGSLFLRTTFRYCNFTFTDLEKIVYIDAKLSHCNFYGAKKADFSKGVEICDSIMPDGSKSPPCSDNNNY